MSENKNLIVLYYVTSGSKHERIYEGRPLSAKYPLKTNIKEINLELIKEILEKEKINISLIDDYRYDYKNKKGLIKINEATKIPIKQNEILYLQIHLKEERNSDIIEIEKCYNKIKFKISQIEQLKKLNQLKKKKRIDLFFLYASPIVIFKGGPKVYVESTNPINYREEIKNLVHIFNKPKYEFTCFFECGTEKKLIEALIKEPKILHISSHGKLNIKKEYSLFLEHKGELNKIPQLRLTQILKSYSNILKKINLVFASTCHSQFLGNLFLENGVKNVICIHRMTPISDKAALQFSENLYNEIIKGNTIEEAFNKAQLRIQSSNEKESFKINDCCCFNHNHLSPCPLDNKANKYKIHEKYHSKKKCECDFEECNIHKDNCELIKLIKENKDEKYFCFEKNAGNIIKICCSCLKDQIPPHSESFKFILLSKAKEDKKIKIFPYKKEGKLKKNRICYDINYNKFDDFYIVGRRVQVKEIFELIDGEKINNIHYIIIHGSEETGKKNFAQSVCVYLYERDVIANYKYFDVRQSILSCEDIKELIDTWNNSKGKFVSIIELNNKYLEKQIDMVNEILNEPSLRLPNMYYFILFTPHPEDIDSIECSINHYKTIKLEDLDSESGKNLLQNLCEYYGYSKYLANLKKVNDLVNMAGTTYKKINFLAELIGQNKNYEEIEKVIKNSDFNIIEFRQNELRKTMEKNISKIYFLLSIVENGLPLSIIELYEPKFKSIKENEDENNLIFTESDNNWYIIEESYKIDIIKLMLENKRKDYISKILKIYSRELFCFINKNRMNVCFPNSNIHYNFNSYNKNGMWKSFDTEIYKLCFEKKIDKINSIYKDKLDKDFNIKLLEKHKENIFWLIEKNTDIIKKIIFEDKNVKTKEYLYQILIMLPSAFISEKNSKIRNVLSKCIYICDKLKSDEGNLMEVRQRLNLFLESLKENPTVNFEKFNLLGDEGKAEANFIYGLKLHKKEYFEESIKFYRKIHDIEAQNKIIYAKFEIACLYYLKNKYKKAKEMLYEARKLSKESNDTFIRDKINIELAKIIEEEIFNEKREAIEQKKEEYEKYLNYVINGGHFLLAPEALNLKEEFNKKIEPDIVMLNSNPLIKKDNYSVLHSSIWAKHNNQYYILNKFSDKLARNLRIKSKVLNKDNLNEALNSKGKILVIQSDDFNEEGEIMLESDYGEGEQLPKDILEKSIIPNKIMYDVVILCFIKSGRLIDSFKGKSKYLITFDDIEYENMDFASLKKYNKLSIDFLVDFIRKTTKFNIEKSFNDSKEAFLKGAKNIIKVLNNFNLITLTLNSDKKFDKEMTIYDQKKLDGCNGKGIFFYPLIVYHIQLNILDLRTDEYTDYILHLIKLILKGNRIINIYSKNDIPKNNFNTKVMISNEVIKFLYRHQKFNKLFFIYNSKKYGNTLKDITNKIIDKNNMNNISKENTTIVSERPKSAFFVINNYDKIRKRKGNQEEDHFFDNFDKDFQYLIISKNPINSVKNYEIDTHREYNSIKSNSNNNNNHKKNKDSKYPSKNLINDNNSHSVDKEDINPNLNNNNLSKNKNYSASKKRNNDQLKIRYDPISDFTVIDHESIDSEKSDSSFSESDEDSD